MDKQITKLDANELLEVAGGREKYVKRSWAEKFDAVDLNSGKNRKPHHEHEEISEMSIDLHEEDNEGSD